MIRIWSLLVDLADKVEVRGFCEDVFYALGRMSEDVAAEDNKRQNGKESFHNH